MLKNKEKEIVYSSNSLDVLATDKVPVINIDSSVIDDINSDIMDYYQDYLNREIDSVIELEDGNWCAFEIKLGVNAIDDAAKNLINIRDSIKRENGKAPSSLCVICGMTNAAYKRPDGVYVVPITALRP